MDRPMTALEGLPQWVYRAIVLGVALYFAFLAVGLVTGVPFFLFLAEFYFGLLAIGMGGLLYVRATGEAFLTLAATALTIGGAAQFFWIWTGDGLFEQLSTVLVFVGICGYVVAIWRAD